VTARLFQNLERFGDAVALVDERSGPMSYAALAAAGDALGARIDERCLVAVLCRNDADCLTGYVGLMRAGAALLLLHHTIPAAHLRDVLAHFRPRFLYAPRENTAAELGHEIAGPGGYALIELGTDPIALHDDLSLLLTTSGTTGSRSFVRLSHRNVVSNAEAIARCLRIGAPDRPITTLPMSYSYGLSIVHSHLLRGAAVVLTEAPLVSPDFWRAIREHKATTFGGVPFVYQMLKKLRFDRMDLPSLRTLTQAGGRLAPDLVVEFADICAAKGMEFIVMYGQTEATARVAYLPWRFVRGKPGSIGVTIPGGELSLEDDGGRVIETEGVAGELVYRGPNVALGYAEHAGDLVKSDENKGVLRTGDIATRDADGFYAIVGRKKRFLKVFGHRVNLDDVEQILARAGFDCACAGRDDALTIYTAGGARAEAISATLTGGTAISPKGFRVIAVDTIARAESGKVDYAALTARADEAAHG
jgi:acyl-CoA synthetase (AMP-forming)/AMP-acid ligase II